MPKLVILLKLCFHLILRLSIVQIAIAMFFKIVLTWLCEVRFLSNFMPTFAYNTYIRLLSDQCVPDANIFGLTSPFIKRLQIRLSVRLDPNGWT